MINKVDNGLLEEIVKIHKVQFKKYDVLSSCSFTLIKSFYEKVSKESSTILLTEKINGKVTGFLYFTIGKPIQIKTFLKKNKILVLLNPACYVQLFKSITNKLLIVKSYKYENELIYIAVSEDFTGRGIARKLIKLCEAELRKIMINEYYIQVLTKNTRAINLYKTLGFKVVKTLFRFGGSKMILKKEII